MAELDGQFLAADPFTRGFGGIAIEDMVESDADTQREKGGEGHVLCARCKRFITHHSHIIEVNGSHHHVFQNPMGIEFELGCFSRAEGCVEIGPPTLDATWFMEYAWQVCLCTRCDFHLGWYYSCGDNSFYGLILDRLAYS